MDLGQGRSSGGSSLSSSQLRCDQKNLYGPDLILYLVFNNICIWDSQNFILKLNIIENKLYHIQTELRYVQNTYNIWAAPLFPSSQYSSSFSSNRNGLGRFPTSYVKPPVGRAGVKITSISRLYEFTTTIGLNQIEISPFLDCFFTATFETQAIYIKSTTNN